MTSDKDFGKTRRKFADSKYKKAYLVIAFIISIAFVVLNGFLSKSLSGRVIRLGDSLTLPASSLSGCVQAFSVAACFFMVMIDYERGLKLTIFTLAFSIFGILRSTFTSGSLASAPGAINCVIYCILAVLISKQLFFSDRAAVTDLATGLPNRYGFERDLEQKIHSQEKGYVVYLHVSGFHDLNVNLGRRYGNQILEAVADRVSGWVGEQGDVYKIEGAEFAIILSEDCRYNSLLNQIVDSIEEPIEVDKNGVSVNCYVTASMGVSDFFDRNCSAEEVMLCTDVAMNHAVNNPGMKICTYNDALKKQVARVSEVEKTIKEALENNYFYLVYQPQYILEGKKLRGFEALVRMRMPDGTIVPPGEFISVAEKSNLIMDIDRFVRRRAMNEFKEVCLKSNDELMLSVNVSAKEIGTHGFADEVLAMVGGIGFPAKCLEIEITEYSFAQSMDNVTENIDKLREAGVRIAVDDFGTGYTSLAQLLNLPVSLLKIDKSLIDNIEDSEIKRDFVKTVIYMGHLMNCEVIAEGVEEENQLRLLNQYLCDFIQGYVWSMPVEYDEAMDLCGEVC